MDDKQRIALVETRTQGSDGSPPQLIRFQFGNHLGSASLELDEQAKIISYEEYYPYGSTSYQAVDKTLKAAAKRYRYTGKERDEETGFSYHGARYYALWLGRWISADPSSLVDGPNLFQYAAASPVCMVDVTGRQKIPPGQGTPPGELHPPNYLIRVPVTATKATSGVTEGVRKKIQHGYQSTTGKPGSEAQAAHEFGSEAATTRPGETVYVRPQYGPDNNKDSSEIRDLAGKIRRKEAEGIKNKDFVRKDGRAPAPATPVPGATTPPPVVAVTPTPTPSTPSGLKPVQPGGAPGAAQVATPPAAPKSASVEPTPATPSAGSSPPDSQFASGGPSPSGKPGIVFGALGALQGANDLLIAITGKDYLGNFRDFVLGAVRYDPEARIRTGEGALQITREDHRAAEAAHLKRAVETTYEQYAKKEGISVEEAKRRFAASARAAPPYATIGPAK